MKFNTILASLAVMCLCIFTGCKSHNVKYYSPDGKKNYSLDKDKISNQEKKAWQVATTANSVNSYKKYLLKYPNGQYAKEAKYIIENAMLRQDELLATFETNPFDQDLKSLFIVPYQDFKTISLVPKSALTGEAIIRESYAIILSDCENDDRKLTSNEFREITFRIKKGCCYNIMMGIEGADAGHDQLNVCTNDVMDKENIKVFIEIAPSLLDKSHTTSASGGSVLSPIENSTNPATVLYFLDGKYYNTATDELFSGNFEGKIYSNGEVLITSSADKEEVLWNEIASMNDELVLEQMLEEYIEKYPNGKHIQVAKKTLKQISSKQSQDTKTTDTSGSINETDSQFQNPIPKSIESRASIDDCLENFIRKGVAARNTLPAQMDTDSTYYLKIHINNMENMDKIKKIVEKETGQNLDTVNLIKTETVNTGNQIVNIIQIGSWMKVELSELENQNAFTIGEITKSNDDGQYLDCETTAKWEWSIQPIKSGQHTLLLNYYMRKNKDVPFTLIEDGSIKIKIGVAEPWYAKLLLPIGAALSLLTFLFYWFRNRKKKQAKDYVFGANLGIAGGLKDVATPPTKPKNVFIAYAKEDEEWTQQIYNQMKVLNKGGYVNIWYDQLIEAGAEHKAEIFKHLEESDIIMLNISSDFLACDFCDELMQKAMERQERGEGVVLIPIIVRPCLWATTPLANLNVFPQNKKPLTDEEWKDADNAIVNVMNEVEGELIN